jgi:hypothetical protein
MKLPDLDRARSEQPRTLLEFLKLYNEDLPESFPRATRASLEEYQAGHAQAFKAGDAWSLATHRKQIMDWLRGRPVAPTKGT